MAQYILLIASLFVIHAFQATAHAAQYQARQDIIMSTPPSDDGGSIFIGKDRQGNSIIRVTPPTPLPEPQQPDLSNITPEINFPFPPQRPIRPPEPRTR